MTFAKGTKVRYKATDAYFNRLNGIEGIVISSNGHNTTIIEVTKGTDAGTHQQLIGRAEGFSSNALVVIAPPAGEFKVGDRIRVSDTDTGPHYNLIGTIVEVDPPLGAGLVKAEVDEDCASYQKMKSWNPELTGKDWYFKVNTLEHITVEKPKIGGAISYAQVERGQRIEVSYESKGVVHRREGVVGAVAHHKNGFGGEDNWTINVQDDDAERYGGKGQRLNWGSDKHKETIVLLEAAPEVDEVLERLLESKGGTVVRAFHNPEFLVREPFSDGWKNVTNQQVYTSEFVRRNAGDDITFFVEEGPVKDAD